MYTDGRMHSVNQNNASTMMQAFNYGTAVFEGMKALWNKTERTWFLFRPDRHFARLRQGAAMLDLNLDFGEEDFVTALSKLIRRNNVKTDLYVRPLLYRSRRGIGPFKQSDYGFSVFLSKLPHFSNRQFRCCFVPQRRPVDGSYNVKLAGNYLLSFLAQREAKRRGFDVAILLSTEGYLSEASVMNLFFIKGKQLHTPSLNCGPLAGITRVSIMELARTELGLEIREGKYRKRRLIEADEIFFTGTGSGVNYARQLETRKFSLSRKTRLAPEIAQIYDDTAGGKLAGYSDWLVPIC
jgi:branched-chain amino acid aminotransferase